METSEVVEEQIPWETIKVEKGFELPHGCAVLFDLFHNCSCKKKGKNVLSIFFIYFSCQRKVQRLLQIRTGSILYAVLE